MANTPKDSRTVNHKYRLHCGCVCVGLRVVQQCWSEPSGWPPCRYPVYKQLYIAGVSLQEVANRA